MIATMLALAAAAVSSFASVPPTDALGREDTPITTGTMAGQPDAAAPEIAIVIDDLGYSRSPYARLAKLPLGVTWSIFPSMPATRFFAQTAKAEGRCAMVHLPLENTAYREPQVQRFLLLSMPDDDARSLLRRHLATVPEAVGLNNHSGDKATEDARLMSVVLTELSSRGLFFVDSMTSPRSVCRRVAQRIGLPFAARDVFLDDKREARGVPRGSYVAGQLRRAAAIARKRGRCLAIGHPHASTLDTLATEIPRLVAEGFRFVPAGEYVAGRAQ